MNLYIDKNSFKHLLGTLKQSTYALIKTWDTIVANINSLSFSFPITKYEEILNDIFTDEEKRLFLSVEGVSAEYKYGVNQMLNDPKNFIETTETKNPSSAFILDNLTDNDLNEIQKRVLICKKENGVKLLEQICNLANNSNSNLIFNSGKTDKYDFSDLINQLFLKDIPIPSIIIEDPYFIENYTTRTHKCLWETLNTEFHCKNIKIFYKQPKQTSINYTDRKKDINTAITKLHMNVEFIELSQLHDRWIFTPYYAISSGAGFNIQKYSSFCRYPRMGKNNSAISNHINNLKSNMNNQQLKKSTK